MDIEWYGHSCFRVREQGVTVIMDPIDKSIGYNIPRVRSDIVTVSHDSPGHTGLSAIKGDPKILTRAGEYEVKGIFITGVQTWRKIGAEGEAKEENVVFVLEFGDLTVCHLGDLSQVLTQAQVEALPNIDVLMVPVGAGSALNADEAAEVISLIEPSIVIPMHYQTPQEPQELDPLSKFLKEMGVPEQTPQESLRVTKSDLQPESQVVVLECKQA